MKNPYVRKRRISYKEFLRCVPKVYKFMVDLHPERSMDECTEFRVNWIQYHEARRAYFRRHWFWYLLARITFRKEVLD